uniref:Endonuclease/exonuclease/phosphatase domain-containing protein n=2 Tax=Aegilops tauschii subsp. strangulata TaxID=200361 RepID=A0A452Y556_AEGTS
MDNTTSPIMCWNVRGLNTPARRSVVCDTASAHRLDILCLQETKIEIWSPVIAREIGGGRLDDCAVLPTIGTRGGIAIFWNSGNVSVQTHAIGQFSITARVSLIGSQSSFWLTTVYGPVDEVRKDEFLAEIARAAPQPGEAWLINNDFNIIYEARDKSNSNINRMIMGKFRAAIDAAGLREIKCKNRRFTWSNERRNPTLVSIDKFFCTIAWENLFPTHLLHAASTSCSDHCPLLLAAAAAPRRQARFRFESFWPRHPHFYETVDRAWNRPTMGHCAFARLNTKLGRVAKDLKIWSKSLFSDARLQLHLATEIVLRLD